MAGASVRFMRERRGLVGMALAAALPALLLVLVAASAAHAIAPAAGQAPAALVGNHSETAQGAGGGDDQNEGDDQNGGDGQNEGDGEEGEEDDDGDDGEVVLAVLALAVGGFVALAIMFFARSESADSHRTLREALLLKRNVQSSVYQAAGAGAAMGAAGQPVITGPHLTWVKDPQIYRAAIDGQETDVSWTSEPAKDVTVPSDAAAEVTITFGEPGTYQLTAKKDDKSSDPFEVTVLAKPGESDRVKVPFLIGGWGGVVGGIVLLSGVVALRFADALSNELTGTLLAAVAGFFFGTTVGGGGSADSGEKAS